jgi:protein phosphatase
MIGRQSILDLEVGQFSHPGRQRKSNEDWLGTFQPDDLERLSHKGSLFLVADGMGGHRSGELASRRAVDQVIRNYVQYRGDNVESAMRQAIEAANVTLYQEKGSGQKTRQSWGTTVVAAVVLRDQLWIANVGDSRAYWLRNGRLRQLSQDHTWAADLDIVPGEDWIGRHLITRALGLKPSVEVDVYPPKALQIGDQVVLCSDGLTSPLSEREIRSILVHYPPQQAAEALVRAANEQGGPDNISVLVICVTGHRAHVEGMSIWEALKTAVRPDTWQHLAADLGQSLPGGRGLWSPWVLIATLLLVALAVIGLGFALGTILF